MNTEIKYDISLELYDAETIIDLIEQGIVSIEEVRRSGVEYKFFGDKLSNYLWQKDHKNSQRQDLDKTTKISTKE
jgi:hypothetical protein